MLSRKKLELTNLSRDFMIYPIFPADWLWLPEGEQFRNMMIWFWVMIFLEMLGFTGSSLGGSCQGRSNWEISPSAALWSSTLDAAAKSPVLGNVGMKNQQNNWIYHQKLGLKLFNHQNILDDSLTKNSWEIRPYMVSLSTLERTKEQHFKAEGNRKLVPPLWGSSQVVNKPRISLQSDFFH